MKKKILAVVGATGLVGNVFLNVLEEKKIEFDDYYLFASKKSEGRIIPFMGQDRRVTELTRENIKNKGITHALFSAGSAISKEFAPLFVKEGALVIDNSSQWRSHENCPLVVPEVNISDAFENEGIIANPNCSTIQAVVVLKPLDDAFRIKRIVYDTYQAVSGAGRKGSADLLDGIEGRSPKFFPKPVFSNVIPQIDSFDENGYTKEELKMINETKKILHRQDLRITATTVRVPVFTGHAESVNVEFEKPCSVEEVKDILSKSKGIILFNENEYPTPLDVVEKDEVFVGRIRKDFSIENGINLWIVADNLRKGAGTNAVQILEAILKNS